MRDLGRNQVVETLPIGRRLAFDADKGRLWVVCASCGKWNLVPFDTRLESIDACERLFRDTRTRYSTDNIGMAKVGDGLTLVRVGKALRPEFASWRYGEQYKRRRRTAVSTAITVGGVGYLAVMTAGIAIPLAVGWSSGAVGGLSYLAWRSLFKRAVDRMATIRTRLPGEAESVTLPMVALEASRIAWRHDAPPALLVPRKPRSPGHGYHRWEGAELLTIGRRIVGGLNLTTGSRKEISGAVQHLGRENGDLTRWLRQEATMQRYRSQHNITRPDLGWELEPDRAVRLADLKPEHRLAVEMWFSEDIERRWLEGELRLLEREWREAEKLAKIADDLVLDQPA